MQVYKQDFTSDGMVYRAGVPDDPLHRVEKPYKSIHGKTRWLSPPSQGEMVWGYSGVGYYWRDIGPSADEQFNTTRVRNRLAEKLHDKAFNSIDLGSALFAEGKESLAMMASAADHLIRGFRHFKRGEFRKVGRLMRAHPEWSARTLHKEAGAKWLSYNFGWAPLVQSFADFHSVMHQEAFSGEAHATVRGNYLYKDPPSGYVYTIREFSGRWSVTGRVKYKVTNPNLLLASRLGLTNPAQWLWEATPFSWVVDYMVNVGSVLDSFDNWAGVEITDSSETWYVNESHMTERHGNYWNRYSPPSEVRLIEITQIEKINRIVPANLTVKLTTTPLASVLSVRRAANLVSVLAGYF